MEPHHSAETLRPLPDRRIVVGGTTGAGKTTLGALLAERLGLRHVELDALHWEPGWQPAAPEVFRQRVADALRGDAWVVDGNYGAVRDIIWKRVDTVIFLDYSLPLILRRLILRTFSRIALRRELWNGNRERFVHLFQRDSIVLWALQTHARRRRQYAELFARAEHAHLKLVHLRSPRETEHWLARVTEAAPRAQSCGPVENPANPDPGSPSP